MFQNGLGQDLELMESFGVQFVYQKSDKLFHKSPHSCTIPFHVEGFNLTKSQCRCLPAGICCFRFIICQLWLFDFWNKILFGLLWDMSKINTKFIKHRLIHCTRLPLIFKVLRSSKLFISPKDYRRTELREIRARRISYS